MSAGQIFRRALATSSAISVAISIASCGSAPQALSKVQSAPPDTLLVESANSLKVPDGVTTKVPPSVSTEPTDTLPLSDPNRYIIRKSYFGAESDAPFPH